MPSHSLVLALCHKIAAVFAGALLTIGILMVLSGAAFAERVALVIGNGKYETAGTLGNPTRDSAAIAEKLRSLDFNVTVVTDAKLKSMQESLKSFADTASGAEIAVIFYAGHAIQVDGENYLIPVDAKMRSRNDLSAAALSATEIYKSLAKAQPQVAVLILDACRNNPFSKAVSTSAGLASGSANSALLVQNSGGAIIGFAAAPGAVAYDGGTGNSPYTTALLRWIDRPGLELGAMLRRVRGTVVELTGGAQVPWVEEALLREVYLYPADPSEIAGAKPGANVQTALLNTIRALENPEEKKAAGEFYKRFVGDDKAATLIVGLTDASGHEPDDALVDEALIWLSIRRSRDPEDFRKFLAAYPRGSFSQVASTRLEEVEANAIQVASLTNNTGILIVGEVSTSDATLSLPNSGLMNKSGGDKKPEQVALTQSQDNKSQSGESVASEDSSKKVELPAEPDAAPQQQASLNNEEESLLEAEASLGLSRDALAGVQMLLAASGKYSGPIDANFGSGTRRAITAFQKSNGLGAVGYLNQPTLQDLVNKHARKTLSVLKDENSKLRLHQLAAVAARGPGSQPVVLRVATISRNDQVHAFWNDLAQDFEIVHPGYRVEITHQPGHEYKQTLLSKLGSSEPPDIMHTWGGGHLAALREAGFARDLTKDVSEGWAMNFRPGVLQSFTQDGQIYGVPASVELVSLWANKALLDKAFVTPEQLATWDGFLQAIQQLRAAGITPLAVGGRDHWQFQFLYGMLAEQAGGRDAFANAYAGNGGGFKAQPFVTAGNRLRQLADLDPFQPDFLSVGEGDAGMIFSKGGAAMMVTGNWRLNTMRWNWSGGFDKMKSELLRLELPGLSGGEQTYGGADGFVVNSKAPDMAVSLLQVLTSPAVQTKITELAHSVPSVSGADLKITNPFVKDVASALLRSSHHQLYYDQALGPDAGEVVNDVAMRLATKQIAGTEAAGEIDSAWRQAQRSR